MLSVVTINLNNCDGLHRTLASVSSVAAYLEIVVVDGGSSDGSKEVIRSFAPLLSSVVIDRDDGIYDAMNKGVSLCTESHVLFLNSGDVLRDSNFLSEFLVNTALKRNTIYQFGFSENDLVRKPRRISTWSMFYGMPTSHQAMLIPVDLVWYDTQYKHAADYDLVLRLWYENVEFFSSPVCLSHIESGGISQSDTGKYEAEMFICAYKHDFIKSGVCYLVRRFIRKFVSTNSRFYKLILHVSRMI